MRQLDHSETPLNEKTFPIIVLCDDITLPANIGSVFRLADAFGVEKVIFGGQKLQIGGRKVKQASRSTHEWVPHEQIADPISRISQLKQEGYQIVALELTDQSKPISKFELPESHKIVVLIGSENHGISTELLNLCEQAFYIPLHGKNSSMNVANSLAILLQVITGRFLAKLM